MVAMRITAQRSVVQVSRRYTCRNAVESLYKTLAFHFMQYTLYKSMLIAAVRVAKQCVVWLPKVLASSTRLLVTTYNLLWTFVPRRSARFRCRPLS